MRVYHMTYRDTMALPMLVFWELSGNVERLLASEQRDQLETIALATHNPEAAQERLHQLAERAPNPIRLSAKALIQASAQRDQEGFESLRAIAG